jgi:Zn-finger nucleic acid-binding protein
MVSRRVADGEELCFFECGRCAGIWLDKEVFAVLVRQAKGGRASLLGPEMGSAPPSGLTGGGLGGPVAYRPCAVCNRLMNRQNYGRRSGVVIDLCKEHGVWFDHDELRRVLEWVRQGGATHGEVTEAARLGERERARPVAVSPLFDREPRGTRRAGVGDLIYNLVEMVETVFDFWPR